MPAPSQPQRSANISGIVRDGLDRSPLAQVAVTLFNGLSDTVFATTDAAGKFSATVALPPGANRVNFRRSGFLEQSTFLPGNAPAVAPAFDVLLPRSCTVPAMGVDGNGNNHNLQLTSTSEALYFSWAPSNQPVRDYWIEVRSGGDLLTAPNVFAQSTGDRPFYRWNTPTPGNYGVVYRTQNDCGLSAPSNVVFVQVQ
jgi:hypothetical protein